MRHVVAPSEVHAPTRSREQRLKALETANKVRVERAEIKRQLASGNLRIVDILLAPPWCVHTAKVYDLLMALPGTGKVKAARTLRDRRISLSKTVVGLSDRQREELIQHFSE